jgi:arylsulfatase A-like enzyme
VFVANALSDSSDHSEGVNPKYPTPRAMMADNDLALGRVIEAVSKSPQWKDTCVFVVEDDGQWGPGSCGWPPHRLHGA